MKSETVARRKFIGNKAFSDQFAEIRNEYVESYLFHEMKIRTEQLKGLGSGTRSGIETEGRSYDMGPSRKVVNFNIPNINEHYGFDFKNHFTSVQNWHGEVTEIIESTFKAKLIDIKELSHIYEVGEFEINEVPMDDKELIQVGATFYFSIGYKTENGTVMRASLLRFQRLPDWSCKNIDTASDWSNEISNDPSW